MKGYSSGLVSQAFWFIEFKKVVQLVLSGKGLREIKTVCTEENLFGAGNAYRARRMAGYLTKRAAALDEWELQFCAKASPAAQKLLNLAAILRTDRLFLEFLLEVYREKLLLGIPVLEGRDAGIFFRNKEMHSARVASWREATRKKLGGCYIRCMTEAHLLAAHGRTHKITPPAADMALERHWKAKGDRAMITILTGVN